MKVGLRLVPVNEHEIEILLNEVRIVIGTINEVRIETIKSKD